MFNSENQNIKIDKVENGFIVSIFIPPTNNPEMDIMNQVMPMIEKMQNKMMGDDWKNEVNDELQEVLKSQTIKPFRQFVAKNYKEVLSIIEKQGGI